MKSSTCYSASYRRPEALFTRESSYCFVCILAIAILPICLSVTRVDQAKAVQAKITKSSCLEDSSFRNVGTLKLFQKFEGGHPERGR